MRKLYTLSNASAKLTALAVRLMQGMFINLRDDTLAFLAGLWTYLEEHEPSTSSEEAEWLSAVALRHATAFFTSFIDYNENKTTHGKHLVDFQTVLPALLVALQSKRSQTREAATECLHALSVTTEKEQVKKVYYYDAIYGSGSGR
jgi:U3 small nucleolar RNA-associated protein 10